MDFIAFRLPEQLYGQSSLRGGVFKPAPQSLAYRLPYSLAVDDLPDEEQTLVKNLTAMYRARAESTSAADG